MLSHSTVSEKVKEKQHKELVGCAAVQGARLIGGERKDKFISLMLFFSLSNHRVGVRRGPVSKSATAAEKDWVFYLTRHGCAVGQNCVNLRTE